MRALPVLVALLLTVPSAVAEFGEEENGYPVGANGFSHDPSLTVLPEALLALQERFANDYPQLNRVGPATVYPYYPILEAEIQRLALDHPDKLRLQYGASTLRNSIYFLEIANFADEGGENWVPLEEREVVMIDGGTHSNEYSGVYFVLALAQWLLDGSPEDEFAQWVLENRYTVITPLANPDGSYAMGRLNAMGVNVNRNFPVLWGGAGTDMLLNNPGPSAMSEVETQLIVDRVEHYQPDYHASIHCCGNLWLFPYGEDGYDPLDVDMMNHICDTAYPIEIREDCGPIWSTIYPASGSTVDTVYEYTGAVAFGFEMSGRSNLIGPWGEPVTVAEVEAQEQESWDAVMHAFQNVHLYGGLPLVEDVQAVAGGIQVTIRNVGYGPLNATFNVLRDAHNWPVQSHQDVSMIMPNETATVVLEMDSFDNRMQIDYQKRIMASPRGIVQHDLVNTNGTLEMAGFVLGDAEALAAIDDAGAPGLGLVALIGAVAVALLVRRR